MLTSRKPVPVQRQREHIKKGHASYYVEPEQGCRQLFHTGGLKVLRGKN